MGMATERTTQIMEFLRAVQKTVSRVSRYR